MTHEVSLAEQYRRQMQTYQEFLVDLRAQGYSGSYFICRNTVKHIKGFRKLYREQLMRNSIHELNSFDHHNDERDRLLNQIERYGTLILKAEQ